MKLKILTYFLLLSFSLLLAGCWNAREIDELAFVLGIGVDKTEEGTFKITVQVAKPGLLSKNSTGGGTTEKPYWVSSSEGKTFFEAIRNMAEFSSRRIFWPHNKVIIIGERLARSDVSKILDFFCRNPELRLRTWVVVTPGEAADLLRITPGLEKEPASAIENLITQRVWTGKSYGVMLKDFMEEYLSSVINPVASRIIISQGQPPKIELSGAAVFNKNKLAGWLDDNETRGLLWLRGMLHSSIVVIPCPIDGKPLSIEVIDAKVGYKSEVINQVPHFTIRITATGNLSEQSCKTNFTKSENLRKLEEDFASSIKSEVENIVEIAQNRFGIDFLGLNRELHMHHQEDWDRMKDKWPELFKKANVVVEVKGSIPRETLFARPLTPAD